MYFPNYNEKYFSSRRIIFVFTMVCLLASSPTSYADETIPPPADVSCSYSSSGITCGNSISIGSSGSNWAVNQESGDPFLEWYLSLLNAGGNPGLVSNYGPRVFQIRGSAGGVTMNMEFSYSELVKFAQGNENSIVLVTAILFNGKGFSSPRIGQQVSINLVNVKNEMSIVKAKNDLAIAEAKRQAEARAAEEEHLASITTEALEASYEATEAALFSAEASDSATASAQNAADYLTSLCVEVEEEFSLIWREIAAAREQLNKFQRSTKK